MSAEGDAERLRADWLKFTSAIGFGDDVTERAATPVELIDPVLDAFSAMSDHDECPRYCGECGEQLAATRCDRCHGGGCVPCSPPAYEECPWCAGIGWVHDGCASATYADLVIERHELTVALASANSRIAQLERAYEVLEGAANAWRKEFYVADPWARLC